MSTQRDKDGNYCSDGMPHVVRKYKGTGAERKDVPCAMTQVIISLQIRKRRQLSSTLGSERVISADASVTTVYWYGNRFSEMATTKFPKDHIKQHEY